MLRRGRAARHGLRQAEGARGRASIAVRQLVRHRRRSRRREHLADRAPSIPLLGDYGRHRICQGRERRLDRESRNRGLRERKAQLSITTEANAADEIPRSATVSLSFTDGWDETVSVEFNLLQRTAKETLGRQITFEEFRQTYAMNKKVEDYVILEGIVVSNTKSHNAGENTQSTTGKIDYSTIRTGPSTSKPTTANTASPSRPPRPKTTSSNSTTTCRFSFRAPRATWSRPPTAMNCATSPRRWSFRASRVRHRTFP